MVDLVLMLSRIFNLIGKDLKLDLRGTFGFASSILYLVAIVFVVHKMFPEMSPATKVGIFWIVILFASINIVYNSFSFHSHKRKYFYYQLYDPIELISAKLLLNILKVILAGIILLFLQFVFTSNLPADPLLFSKAFCLGAIGISTVLTLSSAVASYSTDQMGLVSILALPLLIPILLLVMRLSLVSERMFMDSSINSYMLMLGGIDLLLISLLVVFFPIIWRS